MASDGPCSDRAVCRIAGFECRGSCGYSNYIYLGGSALMSGKRSKVPRTQDVALQRQQLTRRDLLILAGASGAGILLAGCGSGNLFTGSQGSQASRAAGKVT